MLSLEAKRERDRRLRRQLLFTLDLCKSSPRGGMAGRPLVMSVEEDVAEGMSFENDDHAMQLIRDLVNKHLLAEELQPRRRGQSFGPDFIFLRITDLGSRLIREEAPVDPDVRDERVIE